MTIAASDPTDHGEQLLALTDRLTHLMRKETDALKARELDASSQDWSEKEQLAHTYRLEMLNLAKSPDLMTAMPKALRQQLMQRTQGFQELLAEHSVALAAMQTVSEGLVKSIAQEIAAEKAGPRGYGQTGRQAALSGSGIAVNAKA